MSKTKKLFKLIDKLEEELIYINGAFDHIKSHIVNKKDQPIMSASTLTVDLENLRTQIHLSNCIDILMEQTLKLMDIINSNQREVNNLKAEQEKLKSAIK